MILITATHELAEEISKAVTALQVVRTNPESSIDVLGESREDIKSSLNVLEDTIQEHDTQVTIFKQSQINPNEHNLTRKIRQPHQRLLVILEEEAATSSMLDIKIWARAHGYLVLPIRKNQDLTGCGIELEKAISAVRKPSKQQENIAGAKEKLIMKLEGWLEARAYNALYSDERWKKGFKIFKERRALKRFDNFITVDNLVQQLAYACINQQHDIGKIIHTFGIERISSKEVQGFIAEYLPQIRAYDTAIKMSR